MPIRKRDPRRDGLRLEALERHTERMEDQRWLSQLDWPTLELEDHEVCVSERAARVDARDVPVGEARESPVAPAQTYGYMY